MSSFSRKTPPTASAGAFTLSTVVPRRSLRGTKPFLNGQSLISTGLAQFDALLGGGLLLGTLVLLETPRNDSGAAAASLMLVDDLHRYFAAEGVASQQCVVVATEDAAAFIQHQLPLELSLAQKQIKQQLNSNDRKQVEAVSGGESSDAQLTIAWQYEKYLNLTSGSSSSGSQRFCHSFDLSRPMHPELLAANPPVVVDTSSLLQSTEAETAQEEPPVHILYERLFTAIEREVLQRTSAADGGQIVARICLRDLGSPLFGAPNAEHMRALFTFLRMLRALLVRQRTIVCVVSGPLYLFPATFGNELRHLSDYSMELKAFTGESDLLPVELREFHGLLDIRKLARVHSLACHSADAMKYGIKRERRKLKIEKFHLPPEGSRTSNTSNNATEPTSMRKMNSLLASTSLRSQTNKSSSASACGGGAANRGLDPLEF